MASWKDAAVKADLTSATPQDTAPDGMISTLTPGSTSGIPGEGTSLSAPTPEAMAQLQAEFKGGLANFVAGIPLAARVGTALFTGGATLAPVLASEMVGQVADLGREALPKAEGGEGGIKTGTKALLDRSVRAATNIVTQLPFVAGKYNPLYAQQTGASEAMGQADAAFKEEGVNAGQPAAQGFVQKAASRQAAASLGLTKSMAKEALGKEGGLEQIGLDALSGPNPIVTPLASPETMLARAQTQVRGVGDALGNEYRALDNRAPGEGLDAQAFLKLQPADFLARVRNTTVENLDKVNPFTKALLKPQIDQMDNTLGQLQEVMLPKIQQKLPLSFEDMWNVRKAIDAKIESGFGALQRGSPIADETKVLLPLRNAIQDEIMSAADEMTARVGDPAASATIRDLNQKYGSAKFAQEALLGKVSSKISKQASFTIPDYVGMATGAALGTGVGGPAGSGVGAIAGAATSKLMRSKGHQLASVVLDKLANGPPEALAGIAPDRQIWEKFYTTVAQQALRVEGGKPIADAILSQAKAMPPQKQIDLDHAKTQLAASQAQDAQAAANSPTGQPPSKSLLTQFHETRVNYASQAVHVNPAEMSSRDRQLSSHFTAAGTQLDRLQSLEGQIQQAPPSAGNSANLVKIRDAKNRIARSALDTRDAVHARQQ